MILSVVVVVTLPFLGTVKWVTWTKLKKLHLSLKFINSSNILLLGSQGP